MSAEISPVETKSRIPVTLVTGFLGSGKTSLINAALRAPELAKTVVVVNEFGEVGLDHLLFARSSDSVVVLRTAAFAARFEATWSVRSIRSTMPDRPARSRRSTMSLSRRLGSPSPARFFRLSCRNRRWTGSIA